MARPHLYMLIVDAEGNLQEGTEVALYQPATTDPIPVPIYETDAGASVIGNPFIIDDGIIDIYVEDPLRVRIGVRIGSSAEQYIEDIDIGGSGGEGEHLHNGTGLNSTAVGQNSVAAGDDSASLGVDSSANANRSIAIGRQAIGGQIDGIGIGYQALGGGDRVVVIGSESSATASGAVALGADTEVSGSQSVALGRLSVASAPNSAAIGFNASASNQGSVALGTSATTTDDNQIVLGSSSHSAFVPGVLVLRTPGGNQYEIRITDSGVIYPSVESQVIDTSILPATDQEFSGGIGGWTSTGSTLSITNDAGISPNSLLTIDTAQGSDTVSSEVEVAEEDDLIGHAWVYTTATSFQVQLTLEFLDGVGDPVSESTLLVSPAITEEWYKVSSRGIAPAGATDVRLKIVTTSADPGDVVHIESADIHLRG